MLSLSQIHLGGFYELLHHQAWLQAGRFEKSSCFHLCWHCYFHSCKRCLRKFQNQGRMWSGDPTQSWGFTVSLAINTSWGKFCPGQAGPGPGWQLQLSRHGIEGGNEAPSKVLHTICLGTAQGLRLYVTKQFHDKMLFNHISSWLCSLGRTGLL